MMDGKTALAILAIAILVAGCVQPVQQLGCCLKNYTKGTTMYDVVNRAYSTDGGKTWNDIATASAAVKAGYGCMLYNMSDIDGVTANPYKYDYTAATNNYGTCNESDKGTVSACNVTIRTTTGNRQYLIPICTQNDIVGCVNGDCTAMVCGDFKFTPRVAPGFSATASDTNPKTAATSETSGAIPAGSSQSVAMQFYKAQCRFLPMNAQLKTIMKSSNSQINVFRMGVGGSFDEFDQYRYYFPVSDQFCGVNTAGTVDRYMNYLTLSSGTPTAYNNPVGGIASNCVDNTNSIVPAPLAFTENSTKRLGWGGATFDYFPVVPDQSNYKFAHYERYALWAVAVPNTITESTTYTTTCYEPPAYQGVYCSSFPAPNYVCKATFGDQGNVYSGCTAYLGSTCSGQTCTQELVSTDTSPGVHPLHLKTTCTGSGTGCYDNLNSCLGGYYGTGTYQTWSCTQTQSSSQSTAYTYNYRFGYPTGTNGIFKALDNGYYSKELSITHAASIYDTGQTGTTRAPFECDSSGNDCYSGTCNIQTYNRGVLLTGSDPTTAHDVVADCNEVTDSAGIKIVTCAPTKSVASPVGGNPPARTYGSITLIPTLMERITTDYNTKPNPEDPALGAGDLRDGNELDGYWTAFSTLGESHVGGTKSNLILSTTSSWTVTNATQISWQPNSAYINCTVYASQVRQLKGYGTNTTWATLASNQAWNTGTPPVAVNASNSTLVWCPKVTESTTGPPLGGIVFFGKTGTDGQSLVRYTDPATQTTSTIIGYSVLNEADFKNTLLYKNCNLHASDYELINISDPRSSVFNASGGLLDAFKPYFQQRVKGLGSTLGTKKVNAFSVVFSFTPWIPVFEKGTHRYGSHVTAPQTVFDKSNGDSDTVGFTRLGDFLASPPAQTVRQRNVYDEDMNQMLGTSASELDNKGDPYGSGGYGGEFTNDGQNKVVRHTYNLGISKYLILIKYDGSGMLGSCSIDDATDLPRVRTFGWCEPCTTSTLAYQNITTFVASGTNHDKEVYLPTNSGEVEHTMGTGGMYTWTNGEGICNASPVDAIPVYSTGYGGIPSYTYISGYIQDNNVTCTNSHITDVSDYSGFLAEQGSPRTIPDATIIKERLGNYMKSGILPVLDISDASNWNLTNHMADSIASSSKLNNPPDYSEYDFERLFSNMGAAVVIVDHVSTAADVAPTTVRPLCTTNPGWWQTNGMGAQLTRLGVSSCLRQVCPLAAALYGCSGTLCAVNPSWWQTNYPQFSIPACTVDVGLAGCAVLDIHQCAAAPSGNPTKLDEIIKRAGIVREKCADCLTAFQVDAPLTTDCDARTEPATSRCFNSTVQAVLRDPTANYNLDMVTFNYPVTTLSSQPRWSTDHPGWSTMSLQNKSLAVVDDIASYGRTSLQAIPGGGKPSMVVGFDVGSNDPDWKGNFTTLFDALAQNQGELVKAGVTGIIYSPVRSSTVVSSGTQLCTTNAWTHANTVPAIPMCTSTTGCTDLSIFVCGMTLCTSSAQTSQAYSVPMCTSTTGCTNLQAFMCTGAMGGNGLVDNSTGVGRKTDKFCALEDAMQKMTTTAPVAIFSRITAQPVACIECSAADKLAGGRCANSATQLECDDGNSCVVCDATGNCNVPTGAAATGLRCPDGAVTDKCKPCTSLAGRQFTYACTYLYSDGTNRTVNGAMMNLGSDSYSDIIAGLPWPSKCCIQDPASGTMYSYSKQAYASPLSKPMVFPGIGDPNIDCGMGGDTNQLAQIGSFCGYNLPLKQYDIKCTVG